MSNFIKNIVRAGMVILGQWFVVSVMVGFGVTMGGSFLPSFVAVFLGAMFGIFLGEWVIKRSIK